MTRNELKAEIRIAVNADADGFEERILQNLERMQDIAGGMTYDNLDDVVVTMKSQAGNWKDARLSKTQRTAVWNVLNQHCPIHKTPLGDRVGLPY